MNHGYVERRIDGGDFRDVFVSPYTAVTVNQKGKRRKKINESDESQKYWNAYYSLVHFEQKIHANADDTWQRWHLTYKDAPSDPAVARKDFANFKRRVKNAFAKHNLEFKAFWVAHCGEDGGKVHFHLLVCGGLTPADVLKLWGFGRVSVDNVVFDENGLKDCAEYYGRAAYADKDDIINDVKVFKAKWGCTRNLKEPDVLPKRHYKYKGKEVKKIFDSKSYRGEIGNEVRTMIEEKYPGYTLSDIVCTENPVTHGKYIKLKLYKTDTHLLDWMRSTIRRFNHVNE